MERRQNPNTELHRLRQQQLRYEWDVTQDAASRRCPECGSDSAPVTNQSPFRSVDYFRCSSCGTTWTVRR
jgi:predicted Zn finger-like uncharacterized protein